MTVRNAKKNRLHRTVSGAAREPDLTSLINIVFLILIFFIVAGTLRPFSARDIELTKIANDAAATAVPSRLIVDRAGKVRWAGQDIDPNQLADLVARSGKPLDGKPLTIVADGRAPGSQVLEVARQLRRAGIRQVTVMVERGRR
jgi:biopolymer transport protein ExbD